MKRDINILYTNEFGILFKWKNVEGSKVQVVFKETGLYMEPTELAALSICVKEAIKGAGSPCSNCSLSEDCKTILLETPIKNLSFAMNRTELFFMNELVLGGLFQLELNDLLDKNNISII